jgi:hypothetical protein
MNKLRTEFIKRDRFIRTRQKDLKVKPNVGLPL